MTRTAIRWDHSDSIKYGAYHLGSDLPEHCDELPLSKHVIVVSGAVDIGFLLIILDSDLWLMKVTYVK